MTNTTSNIQNASKTVGTLAHQPKRIKDTFAGVAKRVNKIMDLARKYEQAEDLPEIAISKGNVKMGDVPSVSLPPVATCPNCNGCAKQCYFIRNCCMYPHVLEAVARNLALVARAPLTYFNAVAKFCLETKSKKNPALKHDAFRWHVGGDIPDADYFELMVAVAEECPGTKFLAFTKNYKVVNEFLDKGNELPSNLQVLFSAWPGVEMDNPHNLPTSSPLFVDGKTAQTDGKTVHLCGGNCRKCFETGTGCWTLKRGEAVVFPAH